MIQIDLPPLVKRLNLFSRQALEMAASECMSQQAAEITVSHVLIQMLAMPRSDLRVITRQGDIGMEELRQALTVENYTTARSADSYPAFSPMLVEWLKEGWLLASAEMQHSELRGSVLLLALLHSPLRYIPPAAARLLTGINRDRLQQDFVQWTQESAESVVPDADGKGAGTMTDASDTLLARYAKNMTADARNGRLDPVLCRDHEIDLMIDILCRRRKNNPVVVGEAGVGKSALIEGLALRIVAGQVPDKLKNTDIMTLDLGALQAGASVKGEFEKRFKGLMPSRLLTYFSSLKKEWECPPRTMSMFRVFAISSLSSVSSVFHPRWERHTMRSHFSLFFKVSTTSLADFVGSRNFTPLQFLSETSPCIFGDSPKTPIFIPFLFIIVYGLTSPSTQVPVKS